MQQAFLPKFENEGQDASIADAIVAAAGQRYMVITIKHSGSLVTMSGNGFAAKNSLDNEYTAGRCTWLLQLRRDVEALKLYSPFINQVKEEIPFFSAGCDT